MTQLFDKLLESLGAITGAGELKRDETNACELMFDDLPVTIQCGENANMTVFCPIGRGPDDPAARLRLYARLLDANFFFRGTEGATLSVDAESGTIAMHRELSLLALDETVFFRILENFLLTAELWRGECERIIASDSTEPPAAPAGSESGSGWVMA